MLTLVSCDPASLMDANIENLTSQNLSIIFIERDNSDKILQIEPNGSVLFQEGMSTTGSFLEPSLIGYDSIYIKNEVDEIIKIFKQNTEGKNIYEIDDWLFSEPSKRVYIYDYQIKNQDLQE